MNFFIFKLKQSLVIFFTVLFLLVVNFKAQADLTGLTGLTGTSGTNLAIGMDGSAPYLAGETGNILIMATGVVGDNNTTRIGETQNACFISGIKGVTTGIADAVPVVIDSAGQLGTVSSSKRYKDDIKDMDRASEKIYDIEPVTFKYKTDKTNKTQYGLIAEQVAEHMPEIVVYKDGQPETVQYHVLNVLLLNELQKINKKVSALEMEIKSLKAK